jgi:hypothetical protein
MQSLDKFAVVQGWWSVVSVWYLVFGVVQSVGAENAIHKRDVACVRFTQQNAEKFPPRICSIHLNTRWGNKLRKIP